MKHALKQHKKIWPKRCKKRLPFIKTPRVDEILEIRVRDFVIHFSFGQPSERNWLSETKNIFKKYKEIKQGHVKFGVV